MGGPPTGGTSSRPAGSLVQHFYQRSEVEAPPVSLTTTLPNGRFTHWVNCQRNCGICHVFKEKNQFNWMMHFCGKRILNIQFLTFIIVALRSFLFSPNSQPNIVWAPGKRTGKEWPALFCLVLSGLFYLAMYHLCQINGFDFLSPLNAYGGIFAF